VSSPNEDYQGKSISAEAWSTNTSKEMFGCVIELFDDSWPEYEETFIDMQA